MPVLVEAHSVIVRRDAIEARLSGGFEQFRRLAPAATLCTDGELVRVGFDTAEGMTVFLRVLVALGLRYGSGPSGDDVASFTLEIGPVGPTTTRSPCDWIVYSYFGWTESGWRVISGSLKDGSAAQSSIAVPPGWAYETSQSVALRVEGVGS